MTAVVEGKHTPGPWRVDVNASPTIWGKTKAGDMKVADVRGWVHLIGTGGLNLSDDEAITIQESNGHLIAAAPELLEALKDVVADLGASSTVNSKLQAKIAAAIAKAEVRQ